MVSPGYRRYRYPWLTATCTQDPIRMVVVSLIASFNVALLTSCFCEDACNFASDGDCDDGGPGSEYGSCSVGTDC